MSSPSKSAIFQARARLGAEPLQALFDRVARPIGTAATAGGWLAGRRLVAVDGTCLDVADTAENEAFFGRPGVNKGERAAFPQARVVALAECGTHAIFAAVEAGVGDQSEPTMIESAAAPSGARDAAARRSGFFSYALWRKAIGTGADLLWRIRTDQAGPQPEYLRRSARRLLAGPAAPLHRTGAAPRRRCGSGSSTTGSTTAGRTHRLPAVHHDPRPGRGAGQRAGRRLHPAVGDRVGLRRVEDPPTRPADGAAVEIPRPGVAGDLGTPVLPLRDPQPDGRTPPCTPGTTRTGSASSPLSGSPEPPSPTRAIFPPDEIGQARHWLIFLRRLIARINPARRPRASPRVIKRKMPKWQVKRAHHAHWPQPDSEPAYLIAAAN